MASRTFTLQHDRHFATQSQAAWAAAALGWREVLSLCLCYPTRLAGLCEVDTDQEAREDRVENDDHD